MYISDDINKWTPYFNCVDPPLPGSVRDEDLSGLGKVKLVKITVRLEVSNRIPSVIAVASATTTTTTVRLLGKGGRIFLLLLQDRLCSKYWKWSQNRTQPLLPPNIYFRLRAPGLSLCGGGASWAWLDGVNRRGWKGGTEAFADGPMGWQADPSWASGPGPPLDRVQASSLELTKLTWNLKVKLAWKESNVTRAGKKSDPNWSG